VPPVLISSVISLNGIAGRYLLGHVGIRQILVEPDFTQAALEGFEVEAQGASIQDAAVA
jgi:hypothetical protein